MLYMICEYNIVKRSGNKTVIINCRNCKAGNSTIFDKTCRKNILNRGMFKMNKSGTTGVCFNKDQKKWMASIYAGNFKCKFFKEKEDAIKWRKEMEQKFYK